MKTQRSLKNYFLYPLVQFRYVFLIFTVLIIGLGWAQGMVILYLGNTMVGLAEEATVRPEILAEVNRSLGWGKNIFIGSFAFVWVASIILGVYITHRFLGPVVRIKKQIFELKEGNYTSRFELRDGDEFKDLMQDLNELAGILEKKYGSTPAKEN